MTRLISGRSAGGSIIRFGKVQTPLLSNKCAFPHQILVSAVEVVLRSRGDRGRRKTIAKKDRERLKKSVVYCRHESFATKTRVVR